MREIIRRIFGGEKPITEEKSKVPEGVSSFSLRDVLIATSFSPNKAIDPRITRLQIGSMRKHIDELSLKTAQDPLHREARKMIYATADWHLLIEQAMLGESDRVLSPLKVRVYSNNEVTPKYMRQDRHVATVMHTHPHDFPPSPMDLQHILYGENDPFSQSAVIVITPRRIHAIFRGNESPNLSNDEAEEVNKKWTAAVSARTNAHINESLTFTAQLNINQRAQNAFVRDFVKKYNLVHFSAALDADTLSLVPEEGITEVSY